MRISIRTSSRRLFPGAIFQRGYLQGVGRGSETQGQATVPVKQGMIGYGCFRK